MNRVYIKSALINLFILLSFFTTSCMPLVNSTSMPEASSSDQVTSLFKILKTKSLAIDEELTDQMFSDEYLIAQFRNNKCNRNIDFLYKNKISNENGNAISYDDVRLLMDSGWKYLSEDYFPLNTPVDWEETFVESRSWEKALHGWDPIDPLLKYLEQTPYKDELYETVLNFSLSFVLDWIEQYSDYSKTYSGAAEFAWYDMTSGTRLHMLSFLINIAACDENVEDKVIIQLIESANLHLSFLIDEENFAYHNNHGYYQAKGMVYFCHDVPELTQCDNAFSLGEKRLLDYLADSFTAQGVHKEHSPQYHVYLLAEVEHLILDEYLSSQDIDKLIQLDQKAQFALIWMITPDSSLVGFGDTDRGEEGQISRLHLLTSKLPLDYPYRLPELEYYINCTSDNLRTASNIGDYSQSGYAFIRVPNSSTSRCDQDTYLALSAAFYSRVHKHADDLSFDWYESGVPILLDSGRYGYEGTSPEQPLADLGFWYSDTNRIYVESTHAHNTVEIDGISDSRKNVPFYGTGVQKVYKNEDGLYIIKAEVDRREGFNHTRMIILNPHNWLLVVDDIQAPEENEENLHTYIQWFHLNPDADIRIEDNQVIGSINTIPLQIISLSNQPVSISTKKGQTNPRLQGWISFEYLQLIPNWAIGLTVTEHDAHFATLLKTSASALRPIIDSDSSNENSTLLYSWENLEFGSVEAVEIDFRNGTVIYSQTDS